MALNKESFKNPDKIYRPTIFWGWNDRLQNEEIKHQIQSMDEGGIGSFFIHARVGLLTPYLSREWMGRVKTSIEEAKKRGISAWLYDEDKWPSGYAGGLVPRKRSKYRIRGLILKDPDALDENDDVLRVYKTKGKRLAFCQRTDPLGQKEFNEASYVDLMNPNVVKEFIDSTYQAYLIEVGREFGDTVPGIFTDEPHLYWQIEITCLPWTTDFSAIFREKNGYDILNHLPSLFYDVETDGKGYPQIRHDCFCHLTFIVATIKVNGSEVGEAYWDPLQIGGINLKKGENQIEVTVTPSLRNLMGPHHRSTRDPKFVTPVTFIKDKMLDEDRRMRDWVDYYQFVPFGVNVQLIK